MTKITRSIDFWVSFSFLFILQSSGFAQDNFSLKRFILKEDAFEAEGRLDSTTLQLFYTKYQEISSGKLIPNFPVILFSYPINEPQLWKGEQKNLAHLDKFYGIQWHVVSKNKSSHSTIKSDNTHFFYASIFYEKYPLQSFILYPDGSFLYSKQSYLYAIHQINQFILYSAHDPNYADVYLDIEGKHISHQEFYQKISHHLFHFKTNFKNGIKTVQLISSTTSEKLSEEQIQLLKKYFPKKFQPSIYLNLLVYFTSPIIQYPTKHWEEFQKTCKKQKIEINLIFLKEYDSRDQLKNIPIDIKKEVQQSFSLHNPTPEMVIATKLDGSYLKIEGEMNKEHIFEKILTFWFNETSK
ncbi:MAG: hypothetical protein ACK4K1_01690 [Flavobacterium sp.]